MGFYIRKGFNFGPLRLNLSRSGLGASFGVKGARIGIGPRGRYIHMGRGGLYYRQTIPSAPARYSPTPTPAQPALPPVADFQQITSASAVNMADSSAADLLAELNRVKSRVDRLPIVLTVSALILLGLMLTGAEWWAYLILIIITAVSALWARHFDVLNGTAVLNYTLDADAAQKFANLQAPFRLLAQCHRVWYIDAAGHNTDMKRNAGAGTLMNRVATQPRFSRPPKVHCNLELPTLKAGKTTLYFFPDRLLVYDSGGVGAIAYANLKVDTQSSRFVESEAVPSDAHQVDTTWQYVNKKGGPDRRFSNNRQLPVMQYGALAFSSDSGLSVLFLCSRAGIVDAFRATFLPVARVHGAQTLVSP